MSRGADPLAPLEAIVGPPERTMRSWLGPQYEEMARYITSLSPQDREATEHALERWLDDQASPWHDDAALTLARLLGSRSLFAAAVRRARELGVHDGDHKRIEPWESFHRRLAPAIAERPVSREALAYLDELADQLHAARTASRRKVVGAAWLARCRALDGPDEVACLAEGLETIRSWQDWRLDVNLTGLLHALYSRLEPARREPALALLTDDERRHFEPQRA